MEPPCGADKQFIWNSFASRAPASTGWGAFSKNGRSRDLPVRLHKNTVTRDQERWGRQKTVIRKLPKRTKLSSPCSQTEVSIHQDNDHKSQKEYVVPHG